jgi:hypothetical protein
MYTFKAFSPFPRRKDVRLNLTFGRTRLSSRATREKERNPYWRFNARMSRCTTTASSLRGELMASLGVTPRTPRVGKPTLDCDDSLGAQPRAARGDETIDEGRATELPHLRFGYADRGEAQLAGREG